MALKHFLDRVFIPQCDQCGAMPVIHPLEKLLSWVEERTEHPSARVVPYGKLHAAWRLKVFRILALLRLCRIHTTAEHTQDSRVHALFEGAHAHEMELLDVYVFGQHRFFFCVGKTSVSWFRSMPHELLPYYSPLCIDDKFELAQFLRKHDIPAPRSWSVTTKDALSTIPSPTESRAYVTKPQLGTRGRHTTVHHTTFQQLCDGFEIAKEISTRVVVQDEVKGTVVRFTVIGGEKVFAGKREYPFVVSDGVHSIAELVEIENQNPLRDGVFFKKLLFGEHEQSFIQKEGRTKDTIPSAGKRIIISDKNSRRNGTVVEDVTEQTHDTILKCLRDAAQLLASPVLGFDVIVEDVTRPLSGQSFGIIECNSVPYIDVHHRVVSGKAYNVAAEIFALLHRG